MSKDLENFNKKYKTELTIDIPEIDLLSKKIGNDGLKIICGIKFTKLDQLLLEENEISNIDILSKNKFGNKLTAIDLSTNKLTSIEILAKCDFPCLIHLFLTGNQLTSIDILAKCNFPCLQELNLSTNKLKNIDIFNNVKFPNLKELDISKNEISSIDVFAKVKFPQLTQLCLDQNKINSIDVLAKFDCSKLEKLKLEKNNLKSIQVLTKINFVNLTYLSIGDDTLGENVECLTKVNCKVLEDLYLYLNDSINRETPKIQDIVNYFEGKNVTFNFISCDDDNGGDFGQDDDLDLGGGVGDNKNNTGGFDFLLDNENIF